MSRKALVVGIDHYQNASVLHGCVNDAYAVKAVIERNGDGSVNFAVKLLTGTGPHQMARRTELRQAIQDLFADDSDIALFYFAGHGHVEVAGGFLIAGDSDAGHDGVALADVMTWANASQAKNRVIILDSCHAGAASTRPQSAIAEIKEGTTLLTASTATQYADEVNNSGVFTNLLVDALSGSAANLIGDVTPGGVYAHIDQSLGPWAQRPMFKTNVKNFISLRRVPPPIPLAELQQLGVLFPEKGFDFRLDPTFEPERRAGDESLPPPIPENTRKFALLQKYNRVNLVVPIDAPHMWHAAIRSKSCRLTALGEHYRRLIVDGRL